MLRKRVNNEKRPNYFRGQLLLETDLLAEQEYHRSKRNVHNRLLHGTGVVQGLSVGRRTDTSVSVEPGLAIDEKGRELVLEQTEALELAEFHPNDRITVGLCCEESEPEGGEPRFRERTVLLTAAADADDGDPEIVLATLRLDSAGKVIAESISYAATRYAKTQLGRQSVEAKHLVPELRTGWIRMPFHPIPFVDIPKDEESVPEAFRVGVTRAVTPTARGAGNQDPGAGGTMAIPLPPAVRWLTRFRIAGEENEGDIHMKLYLGGWDVVNNKHFRKILLEQTICRCESHFLHTYDIGDPALDSEHHTLALWLRSTHRSSISLIAVECSY